MNTANHGRAVKAYRYRTLVAMRVADLGATSVVLKPEKLEDARSQLGDASAA